MRTIARMLLVVGCLLPGGVARAQFIQYTPPGSLGVVTGTSREQLEESLSRAPFKVGPVRLLPQLYLRDLSIEANVFGVTETESEVSDLRVTVGGGLSAFLKLGRKTIASAFALPEYNFWLEEDELRGWTGRYGAGLFGNFNRMSVSLEGTRLEAERPLNTEVEAPVQALEESAALRIELSASQRIRLFGSLGNRRFESRGEAENRVPGLDLRSLDRDETVARGGVRYVSPGRWSVGLGLEASEVEFDRDPGGRSSSGSSPFAQLGIRGNRISGSLTLVRRDLEFDNREALGDATQLTGVAQIQVGITERTAITAYGLRGLVYSGLDDATVITETRGGLRGRLEIYDRIRTGVFVEAGSGSYDGDTATVDARRDDYLGYGVGAEYDLTGRLRLNFVASEVRVDSNQAGFDRTTQRVGFGLRFAWSFSHNLLPW